MMQKPDIELVEAVVEAVEEWVIGLAFEVRDGKIGSHRAHRRTRLIEALIELAEASEGGRS